MEKKDYHALFRINQLETEGGKCEGGDTTFRKRTYCTYPKLKCLHEKPTVSPTCRLSYILTRKSSYFQFFSREINQLVFLLLKVPR